VSDYSEKACRRPADESGDARGGESSRRTTGARRRTVTINYLSGGGRVIDVYLMARSATSDAARRIRIDISSGGADGLNQEITRANRTCSGVEFKHLHENAAPVRTSRSSQRCGFCAHDMALRDIIRNSQRLLSRAEKNRFYRSPKYLFISLRTSSHLYRGCCSTTMRVCPSSDQRTRCNKICHCFVVPSLCGAVRVYRVGGMGIERTRCRPASE